MKNSSKFLAVGMMALMMLTACQPAPPASKDPQEVVQDSIKKLSSVTSYAYDVKVNGDLKGPDGVPPAKVTFDVKLNGALDMKDPQDPKLNLSLDGNIDADGDGGDGKIEVRLNKSNVFVNLMALNGKGTVAVPEDMKKEFVNKWWSLPIPPEALAEMAASFPQGDDSTLTEEQKKMKALVENTQFFTDIKFVGNETVMGESSFHYSAMLNKDAFVEFTKQVSELQGTTVSDAELESLKTGMNNFDMTADMYIGANSGIMNRLKANITIKATDATMPSGTITFDASAGSFDKAVTVTEPEGSQPFPLDMLGGLLGGGASAPTIDSSFDSVVPDDSAFGN